MLSQVPEPSANTKSTPKVGKVAYSAQALAQVEHLQGELGTAATTPPAIAATAPSKVTAPSAHQLDDESPLEWGMPTSGKLVAGFSENDNRKGVDIIGQRGQAVLASAAGKVVYSGSGLRGYGKLVIIKHNKTYLSAYAHNDQILVKEGQSVTKGQKIAEMGNSDADQVKLHFEIRKFGKPVDPAKYLPLAKS
jgi:lipoprotein NlpD